MSITVHEAYEKDHLTNHGETKGCFCIIFVFLFFLTSLFGDIRIKFVVEISILVQDYRRE